MALPAGIAATPGLTGAIDPLSSGAHVNLTAEGKQDWVHWGYLWEQQVDRKYGHPHQIQFTPLIVNQWDGPYWIGASVNRFSWSDGAPNLAIPETHTGIFFIGLNNGYRITCPADTAQKQLKLYVGVSYARATVAASLSGAGVEGYTNSTLVSPFNGSNAVVTLDFAGSAPGQMLTVDVTLSETLGGGNGINLFAATLAGERLPPVAGISAPLNRTVYTAPATVSISATGSVAGGSVTNLELWANASRIGQASAGALDVTLTNLATNTYVFTARATDAYGLTVTSMPVTVYVTTGGGSLVGSATLPPTEVDLTAEGAIDWGHWGLATSNSFNHKSGVVQVIPNVTPYGVNGNKMDRYADNYSGYSWTDGTPAPAATNTPTGLFVSGLDKGFALTLPASPTVRRVRLYLGLYGAQGRLQAWLSDGSGAPFTSTILQRAYDSAYVVYTLTYSSRSEGAKLHIRWTGAIMYDALYGNVTWQAVTLAEGRTLSCAADERVEWGTPWAFTPPVAMGFCDPGNVVISEVSTVTNGLCGATYGVTRTWQAADTCGNTATCSQNITVADTTPPVLYCAENLTVEPGAEWAFTPPTALDGVDGADVTLAVVGTLTNAVCGSSYVATRTWRASDRCGNSASCSQSVAVLDATPPVITCAASQTIEAGSDWDFTAPLATDAGSPGGVELAVFSTATNYICANTFVATRIWQATDACGNYATCSQSITVADTTPPVIACAAERTVAAGADWEFVAPAASDPGTSGDVVVSAVGTMTNVLCGRSLSVMRTWQAVDACGNTAYCQELVRVIDTDPPRLVVLDPLPDGSFGFSFCTQTGRTYRVLYSGSISATNWVVATNLPGSGFQAIILQPQAVGRQRFYRIAVE